MFDKQLLLTHMQNGTNNEKIQAGANVPFYAKPRVLETNMIDITNPRTPDNTPSEMMQLDEQVELTENTLNDPIKPIAGDKLGAGVQRRIDGVGHVKYRPGGGTDADAKRLRGKVSGPKGKKTQIGFLVKLEQNELSEQEFKLSQIISGIRDGRMKNPNPSQRTPGRGEDPTDHHKVDGKKREQRGTHLRNVEAGILKTTTRLARSIDPDISGSDARKAMMKSAANRLGNDL